jgi:hypothetical protein
LLKVGFFDGIDRSIEDGNWLDFHIDPVTGEHSFASIRTGSYAAPRDAGRGLLKSRLDTSGRGLDRAADRPSDAAEKRVGRGADVLFNPLKTVRSGQALLLLCIRSTLDVQLWVRGN